MQKIIEEILQELEYSQDKFPVYPTDAVHAAAIVSEEAGELIRAALMFSYESKNPSEMKKEAIQTAAMAIRFLLNFEDLRRRLSEQVKDPPCSQSGVIIIPSEL